MKRMIVLMKDKLGGQIMKKFVGLHPETYNYLKDNNDKDKETKICVIKRKLKLQDYKTCLKASQLTNIVNYLGKKGINVDNLKTDKK